MRRGSNCSSSVAPFLLFYQLFTSTARLQGPGIASPWITGFSHTGDGASLLVLRQRQMKREITASFLIIPRPDQDPSSPKPKSPLYHTYQFKKGISLSCIFFLSFSLFFYPHLKTFFFHCFRKRGRQREKH